MWGCYQTVWGTRHRKGMDRCRRVRGYTNCSAVNLSTTALIQNSSYQRNCATWVIDLTMESLFVMGNGRAVSSYIRKEQELSKPTFVPLNLVSTNTTQSRVPKYQNRHIVTKIQTRYRPILIQNTDLLQTRAVWNTDLSKRIFFIKANDPTTTRHTSLSPLIYQKLLTNSNTD